MFTNARWHGTANLLLKSLRTRIIAWFFVPTAIILVTVALVNFYAYQQVTEDLVIERDRDLVRLAAGQLANELSGYTGALEGVAVSIAAAQDDPAAWQDALRRATRNLTAFDGGVLVLDTFGRVVATLPDRPELSGQDLSNRSHFRQVVRLQVPVFSNILGTGSEGEEVIEVAVPVVGQRGEFLGSMVGTFGLNPSSASVFFGAIVRLRLAQGGDTYLVDGNGRAIFHSDARFIGESFATSEAARAVMEGRVGALRTSGVDGGDIVAGFSPVPGTPWGLVTEESWSSLTSGSRNYQRFLILLLALGVAVPILVVTFGLGKIMRPIKDLTQGAKRIAGGDFDHTIAATSSDEIQTLAEQFNIMAGALKESYADLEQRVEARTGQLLESEVRYRVLFEESRDAIFVSSPDGKFIDVNQAALDLFGFTREEIIGSDIGSRYFDPKDQVRFRRALDEVGSVINFEEKLLRSDGTAIDCEISAILRRDEGGIETQVQGIIRDVTQRKKSEQELRDLQEAERELAEVTARLAEIGRIVTSNLDIDEVYDRFAEEVKKLVDFDRISVNVIDHESSTFVFRYVSGVIQRGMNAGDVLLLEGTQTGEVVKTGKPLVRQNVATDVRFLGDQTLLDIGFQSSIHVPLKYQDRIIGVLSLRGRREGLFGPREQSIVERLADQIAPAVENAGLYSESQSAQEALRLAEQKYRRIFDDCKDPIFITSREGRVLDANQAALDVFGYETQDLIGLTGREMCEDPEDHTRLVAKISAEGSVEDYEIRMLRKDGSVADCLVSLTVQRDDQDRIVVYQGMVRDITESKLAAEDALQQTREVAVLEERNRMAREIHDTMAQGFTGIVLQMEAAEQSIEASPGALAGHLNRARTLAREGLQEARRSVWGLMPHALEQSTLDVALQEEVRRFDAEGRTKIAFNQSGKRRELPPDVQTVLLRVCQESLTNIRRHAEASEVNVNLKYHPREVLLSVEDNGVGFDPTAVQNDRNGVSFGLIGMRQRAEQIEGQLFVDSTKNQGTLVRLTIPTK